MLYLGIVASELVSELYDLVRQVPIGRCVAYGDLGRSLTNPVSGYLVGRWMSSCPPDVPWWRVVAKSGELPVHKRDPELAAAQERHLSDEGVAVTEGRVNMELVGWFP